MWHCVEQKNKAGTMIVLYDDVERLAVPCATHLCERGYDNVYIVSGGG